jgi:RimJ/RimL family protein N-acetyltransferase
MLAWQPVTTSAQLETVRACRNDGRHTLFDKRWIGTEEQAAWWARAHAAGDQLFLVRETDAEEWAGFCLLAHRPDLTPTWPWITLVVSEQWRGRGIGTHIYRDAPVFAGADVWAAMWRTNAASIWAAIKAGYRRVGEMADGRVDLYRSGA